MSMPINIMLMFVRFLASNKIPEMRLKIFPTNAIAQT
jgi:hypothetical protein